MRPVSKNVHQEQAKQKEWLWTSIVHTITLQFSEIAALHVLSIVQNATATNAHIAKEDTFIIKVNVQVNVQNSITLLTDNAANVQSTVNSVAQKVTAIYVRMGLMKVKMDASLSVQLIAI